MKRSSTLPDSDDYSGSVIYFDGVCILCNGLVNFVIPRDRRQRYRYATLQSERGQCMLRSLQLPGDELQTFIFQEKGKGYIKSTAALKVCKGLSGLWPLLCLLIVIPRPIRDSIYGWIGKRRYKLFGQRASCRVPSEEERHLFLD